MVEERGPNPQYLSTGSHTINKAISPTLLQVHYLHIYMEHNEMAYAFSMGSLELIIFYLMKFQMKLVFQVI